MEHQHYHPVSDGGKLDSQPWTSVINTFTVVIYAVA
jgi:hypothetical protein